MRQFTHVTNSVRSSTKIIKMFKYPGLSYRLSPFYKKKIILRWLLFISKNLKHLNFDSIV